MNLSYNIPFLNLKKGNYQKFSFIMLFMEYKPNYDMAFFNLLFENPY